MDTVDRMVVLVVGNKFFSDNLHFSGKLHTSKIQIKCRYKIVISKSKRVNCPRKC